MTTPVTTPVPPPLTVLARDSAQPFGVTTATPDQLRRDPLDKAFEGINNLVLFSCRNAVPPTGLDRKQFSELLGRLTSARELHSQGQLGKENEVEFFTDFGALTAAFRPVTIGSLQDSQSSSVSSARRYFLCGPFISNPTSIVRRFSICAILSLVMLLYAQIVWVSGTTIMTEFQKISVQWGKVNEDLAASEKSTESKPSDTNPGIRAQDDEQVKIQILDQRQLDLEQKADAFVSLVDRWGDFTIGSVALAEKSSKEAAATRIMSHKTSTDLKFASTGIVLNIYSTYFLPLLYGLMGACCYMLREIILQIRQKTFRSDTEMSYWVRLFLGVLAGLAIGWFLRSEPETAAGATANKDVGSVLSLAPMALSFLAGYSVELLFTAMDRLVAAFGSTSQQSPS